MRWQRPTDDQQDSGICAVMVFYMTTPDGLAYEQQCPYSVRTMQRRLARGADMPYWLELHTDHAPQVINLNPVNRVSDDEWFDQRMAS